MAPQSTSSLPSSSTSSSSSSSFPTGISPFPLLSSSPSSSVPLSNLATASSSRMSPTTGQPRPSSFRAYSTQDRAAHSTNKPGINSEQNINHTQSPSQSQNARLASAISLKRNPEKSYTGPSRGSLPPLRTKAEAEAYFAKMGGENMLPTRANKLLGVGGWVLGGFSCVYMALYADFGEKEHVFSPLRRQYHLLKNRFFTLSPSEREIVGLQTRSGIEGEAGERSS